MALPVGTRALRISMFSNLGSGLADWNAEAPAPQQLTFRELCLSIDPIQVELGIPLQWREL